ncbi:MAG TPA: hypothetical protein ENJ88_01625 [Phaeodactylibacter sp.]|nr:hypothetical protein [Phaeodactylibacter sp.]
MSFLLCNEQRKKSKRYRTLYFDIFLSALNLGAESITLTGSTPEMETLNLPASVDTDKPKVSPMAEKFSDMMILAARAAGISESESIQVEKFFDKTGE